MILNDGYWRLDSTSIDIYRCHRPEYCFYNEDSDNN